MAAPLAKGLIITASVLVAAGIAFYENEQIREWILNSRRKLALALHSLGDELHPPSLDPEHEEVAADARRRRREEIIRLNRMDMIRQARADGIAVDLDELVKMGREEVEDPIASRADRSRSFDELVGADGTLKTTEMAKTSGMDAGSSTLRHRGAGLTGMEGGMSAANPFDDEAQVMFDRELIGAGGDSVHDQEKQESRESTRTLSPRPMSEGDSQYFSEEEMEAQLEEAIRRSLTQDDDATATQSANDDSDMDPPVSVPQTAESSFYFAPPPQVGQPPLSNQSMYSSAMEAMMNANLHHPTADDDADDEAPTPSGTLTPTEDGFSTAASIIGSNAGDVGVLSEIHSMLDEDEMDARSEATSEAYSMVGASTPGSWTDVESEAGDEEGHHVVQTLNVANSQ